MITTTPLAAFAFIMLRHNLITCFYIAESSGSLITPPFFKWRLPCCLIAISSNYSATINTTGNITVSLFYLLCIGEIIALSNIDSGNDEIAIIAAPNRMGSARTKMIALSIATSIDAGDSWRQRIRFDQLFQALVFQFQLSTADFLVFQRQRGVSHDLTSSGQFVAHSGLITSAVADTGTKQS